MKAFSSSVFVWLFVYVLGFATLCNLASGRKADVSFLQLHSSLSPALTWARNASKVAKKPMAWVHVPKTGSTFLNVLVNLPGACDVDTANISSEADLDLGLYFGVYPTRKQTCPGIYAGPCVTDDGWHMNCDHSGVEPIYDSVVKGHGLIMMRQPEQRIISAYNNGFHSWPSWYYKRDPHNITEYANAVSGCAVKMLTRHGKSCAFANTPGSPCGHPTPANIEEVQTAVQRLQSGFIFVGITEHWDMSVCLFHTMFGGECHASEFQHANTGGYSMPWSLGDNHAIVDTAHSSASDALNTSVLHGLTDKSDGLLYDAAKEIFNRNLLKYGVSSSTCETTCFKHRQGLADPQ